MLTTARLVARRLAPGDDPRFLALHRDREVVYWLDPDDPNEVTEADNRDWLERHLRRWDEAGFGLYAVFEGPSESVRRPAVTYPAGLVDSGTHGGTPPSGAGAIDESRFVGRASLSTVPDDVAELTDSSGAVELGYAFARAAWGQGYATEIGRRLLEVARDDLGLAEVVAYAMVDNVRSRRVLERLGFVYRCEFLHDGAQDIFYRLTF